MEPSILLDRVRQLLRAMALISLPVGAGATEPAEENAVETVADELSLRLIDFFTVELILLAGLVLLALVLVARRPSAH